MFDLSIKLKWIPTAKFLKHLAAISAIVLEKTKMIEMDMDEIFICYNTLSNNPD
jgi:hypothetical protein